MPSAHMGQKLVHIVQQRTCVRVLSTSSPQNFGITVINILLLPNERSQILFLTTF